jgi:hypothetical protein
VAPDLDPEFLEQPPRQRSRGDPGRGLPRAGPLQDVAGIPPVVLEDSHQVGVPRSGAGDPAAALVAGSAFGSHDVRPVVPVPVGDQHGDR